MKTDAELVKYIADCAKQWAEGAITERDFLVTVVAELNQSGRLTCNI